MPVEWVGLYVADIDRSLNRPASFGNSDRKIGDVKFGGTGPVALNMLIFKTIYDSGVSNDDTP